MAQVYIRKRPRKKGFGYEASFEMAPINGKRNRMVVGTFDTKKKALEEGNRVLAEYNAGNVVKPTNLSVADFINNYWLPDCVIAGKQESTARSYKKLVNNHIIPVIGAYSLQKVKTADLQRIISILIGKRISRNTLINVKAVLSSIFNYAIITRFIQYGANPVDGVKIPAQRITDSKQLCQHDNVALESEAIDRIFERFSYGSSVFFPLLFAYRFGLRRGEAYAVRWEDIDFDNQLLSVKYQMQYSDTRKVWYIKAPKYESSRELFIDDDTLELLKKEFQLQQENMKSEDYIHIYVNQYGELNITGFKKDGETEIRFVNVREDGSLVTTNTAQHTTMIIKEELGITNFTFHSLRHTHCTELFENDASLELVQNRLGHKHIQETLSVYSHWSEKRKEKGKEVINSMFSKTNKGVV